MTVSFLKLLKSNAWVDVSVLYNEYLQFLDLKPIRFTISINVKFNKYKTPPPSLLIRSYEIGVSVCLNKYLFVIKRGSYFSCFFMFFLCFFITKE